MSIEALRDALATGARLQAALNASGRDVALIARQGQDLSMVPPAPAAERLKLVLRDTAQLHRLHQPHYSMVAYPFATAYQNSNQWVLEVLASAGADPGRVATRQEAQSWLQSSGYQPSEMRIGVFKRLGGRMFKANVAFDDHPDNLRYAGRINTVTVDSLRDFLRLRHGWAMREISGGR